MSRKSIQNKSMGVELIVIESEQLLTRRSLSFQELVTPGTGEPSERDPIACTNLKLRRLGRAMGRWYDEALRVMGLKSTQFALLSVAAQVAPVRPGVLAKAMGMDASTLTRTLRPLIERGWVELIPGEDSRSRQVVITETGHRLQRDALPLWRTAQLRLEATLGAADVMALNALFDNCTSVIERTEKQRV